MQDSESIKLNLGCGRAKISDFINIDIEESCHPDLVLNFISTKLPYEDNSVDEVVMFHCIEHIEKRHHFNIVNEIWRVLKPLTGRAIFSYPEFSKCVSNWLTNFKGQREFWEATLYGRQLYKSDYHVCIMDSVEFSELLRINGFSNIFLATEPNETYNTIITGLKSTKKMLDYETLLRDDMESMVLVKGA